MNTFERVRAKFRLLQTRVGETGKVGLAVSGLVLALVLIAATSPSLRERFALWRGNSVAAVLPGALLALTNTDRTSAGIPMLTENPLLDEAAQLKADDMARHGYFAHITPDGKTPLVFLDQVGYAYKNVGENLGLNYDDAASAEAAWMNSPEHRQNVLFSEFTEVGFGTSVGIYQGGPATFVVTLFATPAHVRAGVAVAHTLMPTASLQNTKAQMPQTPTTASSSVAGASVASTSERVAQLKAVIAALQSEVTRLTAELAALEQ